MDPSVRPGEIVVMAGASLTLVGSFLPFFTDTVPGIDASTNAWGTGLFPVATLIVVLAVAAGALVALSRFANLRLPPGGVLGFSSVQLLVVSATFAAVLGLAYLLVEVPGMSRGIGYFAVLVGALATLVGAVLVRNESRHDTASPGP